jgi:predicted DsbA family dithiol-disulfide isomerase
MAKFKKALTDRTHKARIDADAEVANKAGIQGTPAFVIGGYFVNGAQPFSEFKRAIEAAQGK